ncbi:CCA tRNA nucleotidyltransferase [Paenibacillus agricola]|uniref:CCA tRNA nucleotidyltransferase n=1 Tax=Paenibacillus agricola TaxID=2716264 RepID=A0ABX0IZP7_9BACL|nr:CCA tRNA nucleotidyltransferase [Paenibacillus agricola]NHN28690.1 CCA tRNA nucleotidyltransferase [Paenibacillus agricola]
MKTKLEQGALKVLQKLTQQGFQAYLVGGCVRDQQLRRAVKDYDIATSAHPAQVVELFERTIPTGLQHGTVSVIMDGNLYEVTTFRKEADYEQFRRPAEVEFIDSLEEDLKRRDFTMNAMALDAAGMLIDPFGGLADLAQGSLRCVGNASERFTEDALRMLRCIRFSSEYELQIEGGTWQALCKHASLLKHIALERVRMELERMIAGANPLKAIGLLAASGMLLEAKQPLRLAQLDRLRTAEPINQLKAPTERWSFLYIAMGMNASETEADMRSLTFSKAQIKAVCAVVAAAYKLVDAAADVDLLNRVNRHELSLEHELEPIWKRTVLRYGKEALQLLGKVLAVDPKVLEHLSLPSQVVSLFIQHGEAWLNELEIDRLEQLRVDGKQLLTHIHHAPGPWLAEVLQFLLHEVALGRLSNETDALIAEAVMFVENSKSSESGTQHEY